MTNNVGLSLRSAVSSAAALQPVAVSDAVQRDVLAYVGGRLEQLLIDGGAQPEVVRAVLAERGDDPALAARSVEQLKVGPGGWRRRAGGGAGRMGGAAGCWDLACNDQWRRVASRSIHGAGISKPLLACNRVAIIR